MKKIYKVLLFTSLYILAFCTMLTFAKTTADDFRYDIEDGEVEIWGYRGDDRGELVIPAEIEGYPVTFLNGAFASCDFTSIKIPSTVKKIGDGTFQDCMDLESVELPEGLVEIGDFAFATCESLTEIEIPDSVEKIGEYAFYNCGLEKTTIGKGLKSFGENAFGLNAYLHTVVLDSENRAFGMHDGVLYDKDITTLILFPPCKDGDTYTIPSTVTEIGVGAFQGCKALSSIEIPSNVKVIRREAFSGANMSDIVISEGVETIEDEAFIVSDIERIVIPDSVKTIGEYAFERCMSLEKVTLGKGLVSVGGSAFYRCKGLTEIEVSSENENFSTVDGILFNKNKTELVAYPPAKSGISYTIPEGVISVGRFSLAYSQNLKTITFPATLEIIDDCGFEYSDALEVINFSTGLKAIGDEAFRGCEKLKKIEIPAGVKRIGTHALANCDLLAEIKLPDSVEWLGNGLVFGSEYENDDDNFDDDGILYIDNHIVEVDRRNNLTGEYTLPKNIMSVAEGAFAEGEIESFAVEAGNSRFTAVDGVLFNKDKTMLVSYPNARYEAETYTIPDGVTTIYGRAFSDTERELREITIPLSVKEIGAEVLCISGIRTVYYEGSPSQWKKINIHAENDDLFGAVVCLGVDIEGVKATISPDGKTFNIQIGGVDEGVTVTLALYSGDALVDIIYDVYEGEDLTFHTNAAYDRARVFVWEDFFSMQSVLNPEEIR